VNDQLPNTREKIVEAARELFFQQGYNATGIAQILQVAGVNSGSLYRLFPTKEDLLCAVLEKYKLMLKPMVIDPARSQVSEPIDRIFAVLTGYRRLLEATEFRLGCPIGNLALEVSNSHEMPRELLVENFDGWLHEVSILLEEAVGYLPDDLDKKALVFQILATMEGAVMLARTYRSFEPFDSAVGSMRDQLERIVKNGLTWNYSGGKQK